MWRRGTALASSPSDQGRDLECEFELVVAGDRFVERRFIECKHHRRGVPPQELERGLAAAAAERPDALLFMVSGFLSNPAKTHIQAHLANNRPAFRILVWEQPDLLTRAGKHGTLLRKYGLTSAEPHLALLHPVHVRYLRELPTYTLDDLFSVLDALPPGERDDYLGWVMLSVIRPRVRKPRHAHESLADLTIDPVDYPAFKAACRRVDLEEMLLVSAIVDTSLRAFFVIGDTTTIGETRERLQSFLAHLRRRLAVDGTDEDALRKMIAHYETLVAETEQRTVENHRRYERFCERLLLPLLERPQRALGEFAD